MKSPALAAVLLGAGLLALSPVRSAGAAVVDAAARQSAPIAMVTTSENVEIRVQGVMPQSDAVQWKWGKLIVPVDSGPASVFAESFDDPTVKRVALVGGEKPRLIVLFRHGARTAKKLTEAATFTATEGGFRVVIPRKQSLAAPTPPPSPAAGASEPVPSPESEAPAGVAAPDAPATPTPAVAVAAGTEPEPTPEASSEPLVLPPEPGETPATSAAPQGSDMAGSFGVTLLILGLGGAVMYWVRRKAPAGAASKGFTVIGNQVLGPKSRIVLMGLGDRRMLIAVSESGTTVVDKWNEGEHPRTNPLQLPKAQPEPPLGDASLAALEFGAPRGDLDIPRRRKTVAPVAEAPGEDELLDSESTAVTGLLALRRQMEMEEDEEEEDAAWSSALAARMNARSA